VARLILAFAMGESAPPDRVTREALPVEENVCSFYSARAAEERAALKRRCASRAS